LHGPLNTLQLKGCCIADKSLITGNILSTELYKEAAPLDLAGFDIACDCLLLTKNEIPIKTSLFKTDAQCCMRVTGSLAHPTLLGSIDFNNGSIYFPYDALFIKKGSLQFNTMSLEPSIELIAKNTLKNYDITLGLHGTMQNPVVTLNSSPSLNKEQLIALLLGGSEDGSLSLIMPQSMTELFEQLLFGSTATISKTQKYLHSLFEPLKSVRLVPKFSDQTGRGGLRGALEIEVTDRLKASILQNFNLTEDTRVDISYALSDEANVKVTKDERGDVGAEIEMKWRW
jgi:translocation and assembly module TamB